MAVINAAFDKFDVYKEGVVYASELEPNFNCDRHPRVQSGEMTVNDVFVGFMATFGDKHSNGAITRAEWSDHYCAVSAQIDNDATFIELMNSTWGL